MKGWRSDNCQNTTHLFGLYVIKQQKIQKKFLIEIMHWKKQRTNMQREGLCEAGLTTFILTQAGRRRTTHFVKLVSSQVKKIEKWSGLAIKQLTSYCVPSPEQMKNETRAGMTPVSLPIANRPPHCVIVWSTTGHAWNIIGQHAAGWFQSDTMRRCSIHKTGPPRLANTDNI